MSDNKIIPNTFQHPNVFVDRVAYYLTGNEEKVLNRAIREILGWYDTISARRACIALSVFTDGKTNKAGERLCLGCGLGLSAVRSALDTLNEFGILIKTDNLTNDGQEYYLQTDVDKFNWAAMQERREQMNKKNAHKIRKAQGVLLNSRGIVEQQAGGIVEQYGGGIVGQQQGNPRETQEKPISDGEISSSENVSLDDYFGAEPRLPDTPAPATSWRDNASEPLADWAQHFRPRSGITAEQQAQAAHILSEALGIRPGSDREWADWRAGMVAFVQSAKGDEVTMRRAAQSLARREPRFRGSPRGWYKAAAQVRDEKPAYPEQVDDSEFVSPDELLQQWEA